MEPLSRSDKRYSISRPASRAGTPPQPMVMQMSPMIHLSGVNGYLELLRRRMRLPDPRQPHRMHPPHLIGCSLVSGGDRSRRSWTGKANEVRVMTLTH